MNALSRMLLSLFFAGLAGSTGCSTGEPASPSAPAASLERTPTYYDDVEPILHDRCTRCHQPNDIAPFSLVSVDDVLPMKGMIANAVRNGIMPPMPALQGAEGCPDIDDERVMPASERDVIERWVDSGAPLGQPRPARPPASDDGPLGPPTHTFVSPVAYQAPDTGDDDYRCFVIDPNLSEAVGVSAVSVRPGTPSIVHHATVFVVPPEAADAVQKLDDADPGAGYSCFGGVGVSQAYTAGGWVPGMTALPPPRPGLGGWLLPKWRMILQVHYNFANGRGTDRSSVVAWKSPQPIVEIPGSLLLGDWAIDLPAGQKSIVRSVTGAIVSATATPGVGQVEEGLVYAVWGHEHLLGKSFRMELVHADGTAQCLLSIPQWNFHWQAVYQLKHPVLARAGEQIRVTCEWDNSPDNQPTVDGRRAPPREVRFGETTTDEMCIGSLAVMRP
jgi:hypothetical protein